MTLLSIIPNLEFFDNYLQAIAIATKGGEILFTNPAFTQLTGYTNTDIPPTVISNLPKEKSESLADLTKKNSDTIPVKITATGINLPDNQPGIVYTFYEASEIDVVKQQLAELVRKLAKTTEELDQLAYVASHDLQEPLRTITSYIQLVQKNIEKGNLEATGEFMKFVVEGAGRMQGLINDLLQYSRLTQKGGAFAEVDLNNVIKVIQAQMAGKISEYEATVVVGNLPKVHADPVQINRLFQAVIDNALKFRSPERKPMLEISVQERGNEYLFEIKDNGLGIEEKFFNRIFVIFQRLHARGEYEGTGLGLAVAKKIVERHGGEMWVESEKGTGSKFYFTLKKNIA